MPRRVAATAFWLGLLALVARVSWGHAPTEALLRLSWRTEGQRVKHMLAGDPSLPKHMQLPEGNYEFRLIPYRLAVRVDGQLVVERLVTPPGVRHDRPLMVLEEIALPAGDHSLEVEFSPAVKTEEPPRIFSVKGSQSLTVGRVLLVTLDPTGERLVWAR